MAETYANNPDSTLATAIDGSSDPVTFSVASGHGVRFSDAGEGDQFRMMCESELLLAIDKSGDVVTANRAQEGTAIASHAIGTVITQPLTRGSLLAIRELSQPDWYGHDFALVDNAGTWEARNVRTGTPTVDNTNNDPAVCINNALGSGSLSIVLLDSLAPLTPITVPAQSLVEAHWGPTWAGGVMHAITPGVGFSTSSPLVQITGNGGRVKGLVLQGNSACGWCITASGTDDIIEDCTTYDGLLGGATSSANRVEFINPHFRQPNNLGYACYVTGGADVMLGGVVKLSGGGPGVNEAALRIAGSGFSVGGTVHITGGDAMQQTCLVENDGSFSNVWRFDTAKKGNLVRVEGGGPAFVDCNFYMGAEFAAADANTYAVIRHNAASIIQVIGCSSTIANDPNNRHWQRFITFNGSNQKAVLVGNKMGSITAGNTPWNNVPLIHSDNTLNQVSYDSAVVAQQIRFGMAGMLGAETGQFREYVTGNGFEITNVRASVGTAPTGAAIRVDINKNGTTLFTDQTARPNIAVGNFFDDATPAVTTVAAGDYLTMDVDQVGSIEPGRYLHVQIFVRPT